MKNTVKTAHEEYSTENKRDLLKIVRIINYRINFYFAKKNLRTFPQIAIFAFDHIGLFVNADGRYELSTLDAVFEFLDYKKIDQSGIAIDVGANIGNHTIFFAEKFSSVIAFEPNPKVFQLLQFNTGPYNVKAYNVGLSNSSGYLKFQENSSNIGASCIISKENDQNEFTTFEIETKTLDAITAEIDSTISLLKIDIEGHELQALQGAIKTIKKHKPVILFEQQPEDIKHGSSASVDLLRSYDYGFYTCKSKYYLGNSFASKLFSLVLVYIFGESKIFQKTEIFRNEFYDMIVAIPN